MIEPPQDELPPTDETFFWPQQAMQEKNWSEAARRWAVLRKAYPRHPAPWVQGALAHIEASEYDRAGDLLNYSREYFSNNPNAFIHSAELAIRKNDLEKAEEYLSYTRKEFPDFLSTWIKSSDHAIKSGNMELASEYNQKARQIDNSQPTAFIQFAELAMKSQDWKEALKRWEDVRKKFPHLKIAYTEAAEAAKKINKPKLARELLLSQQYGTEIFSEQIKTHRGITSTQNSRSKFIRLFEMIWVKAFFGLHSEVQRNFLSYGWWIFEPILHMSVYYVVFGLLLQRGGENYPVFLLTGLVPWMWFAKAVSSSSNSILSGQNLMLQVGLPSIVFPLEKILQATIKQIPVFILLLFFIWILGSPPSNIWWSLLPVVFVQLLLVLTVSCLVAAVIPFIRDLSYLVPTGLMFLMFLSGIFYEYSVIPQEWQDLFLLNPIAFLLKCYREILIYNSLPDMITLSLWGAGSLLSCILLIILYERLRYIYPRVVLE